MIGLPSDKRPGPVRAAVVLLWLLAVGPLVILAVLLDRLWAQEAMFALLVAFMALPLVLFCLLAGWSAALLARDPPAGRTLGLVLAVFGVVASFIALAQGFELAWVMMALCVAVLAVLPSVPATSV